MNENNKTILLVTQKSADIDDPIESELYKIGCSATILQLLKLPDGTMKVLVEGVARQKISKFTETNEILYSECEQLDANEASVGSQNDALGRALEDTFNNYVKLNKKNTTRSYVIYCRY
jgi:ATP-dependent Lon protease